MLFLIGVFCGIGAALAVRAILLTVLPRPVAVYATRRGDTPPKGWEYTRNFLYYDGTVMPTIKEEPNEQ